MKEDEIRELSGRERLLGNVVTSWAAQLIIVATGFFLPRIIDQELGQHTLGVWDLVWSITSYISLYHLGIGASLNRYIAMYRSQKDPQQLSVAVSTTITIQSVSALFVLLTTSIIAYYLPSIFADKLGEDVTTSQWVLFLTGSSIAVQLLFDTSRGVLTGCHRWDLFNAINSITQIIGTLAMIGIMLLGGGLIDIASAYLAMMFIQGASRAIVARRICPEARFSRDHVSPSFAREIFSFGIKSVALGLPALITVQGTYLVVVNVLGPATLAIFARPAALTRFLDSFISRFSFVLTPMAESIESLEGSEKVRDFALETTRYCIGLSVPLFSLLAMLGPMTIEIWMGKDYVNEAIIYLMALAGGITMAQSAVVRITIGLNRHGRASFVAIVLTLVTLALLVANGQYFNIVTIEYYAFAMASTLIVVNGIYLPIYCCNRLDLKLSDYLKSLLNRATLITLGGSGLAIYLAIQSNAMEQLLIATAYGAMAFVVFFFLGLTNTQRKYTVMQLMKLVGA